MDVECTYAAAQMQAEIQMHVERDRDIAEVEGASLFKVQQWVVVTMIEKNIKSPFKQQRNIGAILYIFKTIHKNLSFQTSKSKVS